MKSAIVRAESALPIRSAVVIAATKSFDLTLLGVPEGLRGRKPTELFYPPSFNPQARSTWDGMFKDELFLSDYKTVSNPADAWLFVIRSFMDSCNSEGVAPFKNKKDATMNNAVRAMIFNRRTILKRCLDRSRIFKAVRVLPNTATHKYEELYTGGLRIHCSIQFEHGDQGALETFLRVRPMFMLRDVNGGFSKSLLRNLKISVTNIRRTTAVLSYALDIHTEYFKPDNIVTKTDTHNWLDKEFFFPMVRGYRFDTIQRRVKF